MREEIFFLPHKIKTKINKYKNNIKKYENNS